jgi:hypothetical protein
MQLPGTGSTAAMRSASERRWFFRKSMLQAAVRQIELCDRNAEAVIARERKRSLEAFDRRDWR